MLGVKGGGGDPSATKGGDATSFDKNQLMKT